MLDSLHLEWHGMKLHSAFMSLYLALGQTQHAIMSA